MTSRLIITRRGETARVIPRTDGASLVVNVLTDAIEPELSHAGFVSTLVMEQRQVQALICQWADAIGMAIELSDGPSLAERVAVEGMRNGRGM